MPPLSAGLEKLVIIWNREVPVYTVDPLYRGALGPVSTIAIYLDRDISRDIHYRQFYM